MPATLDAQFRDEGGQILPNVQLIRIDAEADRSLTLTFRRGNNQRARVPGVPRLVLALPRASLDPFGNSRLRLLFDSVLGYPAFKLFLLYRERWWEKSGGPVHGRSVSDLPIRQTYYFRPDGCESPSTNGCPDYGLLMAMGPGFCSELVLLRW